MEFCRLKQIHLSLRIETDPFVFVVEIDQMSRIETDPFEVGWNRSI